eukprot:CAMPEP_0119029518 /NCGR_PEP_ID=MMETSP1176-20130426/40560_1 /TAXON_ID=265551 /ORGANISM="Synedropsis recta cf, Strain CCMP1620" /LENGTH=613 /DNA_ID=CAMNT_0006985865 /DNA_START=57 /DNA_END=1899 /DNA_ORIENTATION=-
MARVKPLHIAFVGLYAVLFAATTTTGSTFFHPLLEKRQQHQQQSSAPSSAVPSASPSASPVITTKLENNEAVTTLPLNNNKTAPDSLYFIHSPKTGTSLISLIRNRLPACMHKDFTCFGVYGGGFWAEVTKDKQDIYPFDPLAMFNVTVAAAPEGLSLATEHSRVVGPDTIAPINPAGGNKIKSPCSVSLPNGSNRTSIALIMVRCLKPLQIAFIGLYAVLLAARTGSTFFHPLFEKRQHQQQQSSALSAPPSSTSPSATPVTTKLENNEAVTTSPLHNKTAPDSLYFIHCPKTGTSLISLLRNRLPACKHKDFTCFGVFGGGFWGQVTKDKEDIYPFDAKAMFNVTSRQVARKIESCHGALQNCERGNKYHCSYQTCKEKQNKVTMFREPTFGVFGGGFWGQVTKDKEDIYPFDAKAMFNVTSRRVARRIESCHGAFTNCAGGNKYHCSYQSCRWKQNKVTMFREPTKWFKSYMEWRWPIEAAIGNTTKYNWQSQMEFTTGVMDDNVSMAIDILQNMYTWWGITDYWKVSVCVFHCELGGEQRESELQNSRNGSWSDKLTPWDQFPQHVPRPHVLVPNMSAYVHEHYSSDILLYGQLLGIFKERAGICGCNF